MRRMLVWTTIGAGLALAAPLVARAGSFQLNDVSAASLARAHAGDASDNTDATAVYYNPALLTRLKRMQFIIGATDYAIHGEFSKTSATDLTGQPLSGGNGGDMGSHNRLGSGVTPAFSFAAPLNNRTVFGIGLNVPFGLTTTYDGNSVLRYQAQYTSIEVIDINPSVAYQVSNDFSIGFGVDAAYWEAKLTNQIDYGAVCYSKLGPITCNNLGLYPQSHDGYFQISGTDWAYGWNAGLAWHHGPTTVGLAYRSRLFFNVAGTAEYNNVPAVFSSSGAFRNTGANTRVSLPDTIDLSWTQDLDSAWSLSATLRYVRWGVFNGFTITYDNPNQPPTSVVYDYRNVWYGALGVDWRLNPAWTLHGGVAYDESPIRDQYRDPRLPGSNRRWVAAGATWNLSPQANLSVGYAHLFVGDHIPMNNTGTFGETVVGQWAVNANLYSLQFAYSF